MRRFLGSGRWGCFTPRWSAWGWVFSGIALALETQGAVVALHDIQGKGSASPIAGTSVVASGIVTAIKLNGFFIQLPDNEADADPETSEGVFCQTASALPASVVVGNRIQLTGTVSELRPSTDLLSPPLTALTAVSGLTVLSVGNPLPTLVLLDGKALSPTGSFEQLERYEGMRVRVASLVATAPTQGLINESSATAASSGIFYGVLPGIARPFREPGISVQESLPAGAPCCVPRFDSNPEVLRVDTRGQKGAKGLDLSTGALVSEMVGVLDYQARSYTLLLDPLFVPSVVGGVTVGAVPVLPPGEFSVASINLNRFTDPVDDPDLLSEVLLTLPAFNARLAKFSLLIRNVLRAPEILAVQEVENLSTLQSLADRIAADAAAAGSPPIFYQAFVVSGNESKGSNVGWLVRTDRIQLESVRALAATQTFPDPVSGISRTLFERPPLQLRFSVTRPGAEGGLAATALVVQLTADNSNGDLLSGVQLRGRRLAQAAFIGNLVRTLQTQEVDRALLVLGGFESDAFNDGYLDLLGIIEGDSAPSHQVIVAGPPPAAPRLFALDDALPAATRYSVISGGSARALDHILVNAPLRSHLTWTGIAHANADFPEVLRSDVTRPERATDRDPLIAHFAVVVPLRFLTATRLADGALSLVASGETSRTNLVQVNTNLANGIWTTIGTAKADLTGALVFTDTNAMKSSPRFYRILAP